MIIFNSTIRTFTYLALYCITYKGLNTSREVKIKNNDYHFLGINHKLIKKSLAIVLN